MGKKKGKGQGPAPRSGSNSLSESVNTPGPAASSAAANVAPATATTASPAMPIPISAAVDKKSSPVVGTPPALPKSPLAAVPTTVTQLASSPLSVASPPIAVPIQPAATKPNTQGPKPSPPIKPSSPMTKTAPISFPSMPQSPNASAQLGTSPSRNIPAMPKGRQNDFSSQITSAPIIGSPGKTSGIMNVPIVGSPAKNAGNLNASIIGSPGQGAGILNAPIIGSPSKNTGIINAPVIGSPGKNSGSAPVKLSDIGITPISPKSPGSPKVDMKFMNPLQRIPDEPKKEFAKVDQKPKEQEKFPTPGEKPIDDKKLSPKNAKGQQKASPKVERKAQTPDKKTADDTAQQLPFTASVASAIKQELKMQDPLKSVPLLTDFSSFLSSTTPSLPAQGKDSSKTTQENKPFLPPLIPSQVEKQQAMDKKSTEVKSFPISQPPLSLESLLGNISAKDLTKDTVPKQSPLQQLPVAEIKGVAKDIKNVLDAKQQPKAAEKPLPAMPVSQQKKELQAPLVKDIEEPKKAASANVPKVEENAGKGKSGSPAPAPPAADESIKAKDNKQQQKPEIPKKPTGLKPSKQQTKPEAVQKPKTDEPEQKHVPEKNQQPKDDKLNKPSIPEFKPEKEQASPKSEKLQLAPEVPVPVNPKISTISPVKEQTPEKASSPAPKQSPPPKKNENNEKAKPEAPKKEENTTKGKDSTGKKGKNAQKNLAEEFLKERKVSSSENAEAKGKNEKDSTKPSQNDNASIKSDVKQDKTAPKEVAPAPVAAEKVSQKVEEKKVQEGKKTSEPQGKQPQLVKVEAKPADKNLPKDDKQEKNEPKKKPGEDTPPADKSAPKDQKADQPKGSGVQQKQPQSPEKGNKKDKNLPKDVKVQKDEKVPAKDEIIAAPKEEKVQQQKAKEEKSPASPSKDSKDKSAPKSNESEKSKKEQQKNNKPQEIKPQTEKTEQPAAETAATKDEKKSQNKQQQQQKKPATQDETKAQGKQGPKEKKVSDKVQAKEVEPKSESKTSTEADKNTKEKADNKKTDKPAQQPAKPKSDKPKAKEDNKAKEVKVAQPSSAVKVEASLSDDEDLEPNAGDTPEVTAAKKKRRRRKKNKKPAGTEGATNDASSEKPKPPENKENKSQKKPKDNQQTPNKPQENQQGTKTEKPAQPKPEKVVVPTEQSKPSSAPSSTPVEAKQGDNDGLSQDAQAKKKKNKNKKKKQGPGGTEDSNESQNDSAGQKKTPFEFHPSKLTLNPLAHHLSNCCCICKTTSGNNNSPLQTCTACSLACYCCRDHQKQHWPEHKDFCTYISSVLSKERPYFFTPAEKLSQDERRHFRLSELQLCQKALNRNPTPLESALILHPRACYTCYKPAFQNSCSNCHSVNFCCQEHFPQNHVEWCATLRIKLLFVQSQNQFGSAGVSVPHPSKILYPVNSNMKEYLESLDLKPLNKMPKELYLAHVSELATYPLTLLQALQLLSTQGATNPLDYEHLVVHVVGAEDVFECCQILKWKYFFANLLPKLKTLHLVFIGCELTIEDEHVHVEGRLVYEFHARMTYLDYCRKCYIKPSIVCAFNSGLYRNTGFQGTDSWGPSLCPMLKINPGAPVLFTAYTHMESQLDLQRVKEIFANSLQIVQLPLKNPFASIFPNHNLVSESECPVAFRNYYLTIVRHA